MISVLLLTTVLSVPYVPASYVEVQGASTCRERYTRCVRMCKRYYRGFERGLCVKECRDEKIDCLNR